jgi:mannose-6-phosphate isomerase-like protein (cupin superfamily)
MQEEKVWEAFELSDIAAEREKSGRPWLEFLKVPTLNSGLYVLAAGAEDPQGPHDEDELYYIISGRAVLRVAGEDQAVQPGSIIYVKAHIEHSFHSITEELQVLVFFSSAKSN